MSAILSSLRNTIIAGFVLAIVVFAIIGLPRTTFETPFWAYLFRYLHIMSGVMWIGLLWYFNFVQTPSMPQIPDEQKPAVSKVIAPRALFWFRWAAMATLITGVIVAGASGYIFRALSLQEGVRTIG